MKHTNTTYLNTEKLNASPHAISYQDSCNENSNRTDFTNDYEVNVNKVKNKHAKDYETHRSDYDYKYDLNESNVLDMKKNKCSKYKNKSTKNLNSGYKNTNSNIYGSNTSEKNCSIRPQSSVNKELGKTTAKNRNNKKINPQSFEKFSTMCERKTTDYSHLSKNYSEISGTNSDTYFNRKNSDTFCEFKVGKKNDTDISNLQKDIIKKSRKLVTPCYNNSSKSPTSSKMSSSAKSGFSFSKKFHKATCNSTK